MASSASRRYARSGHPCASLAVLVVDRPPVAQPGLAVDDDRLTGPLDQELVGHTVPRVLEHREINPIRPGVLGHLLGGLMGIRVHGEEDDPLVLVGVVQLDQAGDVKVADRASVPRKTRTTARLPRKL